MSDRIDSAQRTEDTSSPALFNAVYNESESPALSLARGGFGGGFGGGFHGGYHGGGIGIPVPIGRACPPGEILIQNYPYPDYCQPAYQPPYSRPYGY